MNSSNVATEFQAQNNDVPLDNAIKVDPHFRSRCGCLACGSQRINSESSVVSAYLAYKAWDGTPEHVLLYTCSDCGLKFYERGLTDAEGDSYYHGYRNEAYFTERNHFEPFYTRAQHNAVSTFLTSERRRVDLAKALEQAGFGEAFDAILDYGGGGGSLIRNINARRKLVFDPSGTAGEPGIEIISTRTELPENTGLVTCAQVLEHVSDPAALIRDMFSLVRPGGAIYLEVPDQSWRTLPGRRPEKLLLSWLSRHPKLLLAADIYSTFFRIKFGVLPLLGFVPMREHINFFTKQALYALARHGGLIVKTEGVTSDGSLFLIATKPAFDAATDKEIDHAKAASIRLNRSIPGQMSDAELTRLSELAATVPPHGVIVEVGSLYGLSSWHIAQHCHPTVTVFCIDPWKRERWIVNVVEKPQNALRFGRSSFERYTADCNNIVMIQGFSPGIAEGWQLPIDLYVEDAVHANPILGRNLECWSRLVKPGGIICGHDYSSQFPDVITEANALARKYDSPLKVSDTLWAVTKTSIV